MKVKKLVYSAKQLNGLNTCALNLLPHFQAVKTELGHLESLYGLHVPFFFTQLIMLC